jgi:uncharacterized protein (TIGR02611 family)
VSPLEGNHRSLAGLVRRAGVLVTGVVLVLAGILMLVLPGPGLLVILIGLTLLATEFAWARRALDRLKAVSRRGTQTLRRVAGKGDANDPGPRAGSR